MSDREMYCDREPYSYDRDSCYILFGLSENSIQDEELEYWKEYKKLFSSYRETLTTIRMHEVVNETHPSLDYMTVILENTILRDSLYDKLAHLEETPFIQNILRRERKVDENIEMSFPKSDRTDRDYTALYREGIKLYNESVKNNNSDITKKFRKNKQEENSKKTKEFNNKKNIKEILLTPKTYIVFAIMFLSTVLYTFFLLESLYGVEEYQLAMLLSTIPILFSLNYFFIFKHKADRLKISIYIVISLPISLMIMFISGIGIGDGFEIFAILISAIIMFYNLIIL